MSRLAVIGLLFVFGLPSLASAQVTEQVRRQRREMVGDLLKTLIESQIESQQVAPRGQRPPNAGARPGRVSPPPRVTPPRRAVAGNREMQQFRKQLTAFGKQCDGLVVGLQAIESVPSRVLLADAMQVKAQCDGLIREASYIESPQALIPDYQKFDQNWRVLGHRIRQTPGIDSECLGYVDQMYTAGGEMCNCLGIDPSINRAQLLQLTSAMKLSFQHLLQDLYYDNSKDPKIAAVIEQGQELLSQIGQGTQMVQYEPYDVLVAAYKQTSKDWRRYVRKLRPYKSERVRRGIQEIEQLGRAINEQLWLEVELDFEDILDITRGIEADTNRLFASITLDDLLECQNPGLVINNAREFQRLCGTFAVSLEQGLESWMWDYQLFNVQWQSLRKLCHPIKQSRVVRRIQEIDEAMQGLNQLLGQGPAVTHNDLVNMYANLDLHFSELDLNIKRNIANDRSYDRAIRQSMVNHAHQLHDTVHKCHKSLLQGRTQSDLTNEFNTVLADWTALKRLYTNCNEQHRATFARHRREIEPVMVKLQVVFTN